VINPQMAAPCIRFALNQLRGYLNVKSRIWPVSAERRRFEPQYCRWLLWPPPSHHRKKKLTAGITKDEM
jgi:hypothetical protein